MLNEATKLKIKGDMTFNYLIFCNFPCFKASIKLVENT